MAAQYSLEQLMGSMSILCQKIEQDLNIAPQDKHVIQTTMADRPSKAIVLWLKAKHA